MYLHRPIPIFGVPVFVLSAFMILFFGTESTGLSPEFRPLTADVHNWPRMVQLGYLLYTSDGRLVESGSYIIRPVGYTIPPTGRVHGIDTERALLEGEELADVLEAFKACMDRAQLLVAHNMEMQEKIVGCEFERVYGTDLLAAKRRYCTMKDPKVIALCKVEPFKYGSYKWPQLAELYATLFNQTYVETHDAGTDVQILAKCFFTLVNRKIIP